MCFEKNKTKKKTKKKNNKKKKLNLLQKKRYA